MVLEGSIYLFGNIYNACVSPLWTFLISPVDYCENFSTVYTSPIQGLQGNFITVGILIFVVVLYYKVKGHYRKVVFPVYRILSLSVLSSYLISALSFLNLGFPSEGTSIIAFSLLTFLFLELILDLSHIRQKKNRVGALLKLVGFITVILVASLMLEGYIINNSGALLHLAGAFVVLILAFLFYYFNIWIKTDGKIFFTILYIIIIIVIFYFVINSTNSDVLIGRINLNQYGLINSTISIHYFGAEYPTNSIINISIAAYSAKPCNSYQNYTLNYIKSNSLNFTIIKTYPELPISSLSCRNNLLLEIKLPVKSYKGNLSILENFTH
ncbi:MAG: hypothetical protein QXL94_07910 [Candidatus Parvarchaeum sp.]